MYNYSQLYIYSLLTVYTPDLMGEITIFQLQFQNHSRLIFYALDFIFLRIAPYFLRIALFYLLEKVNFAIKIFHSFNHEKSLSIFFIDTRGVLCLRREAAIGIGIFPDRIAPRTDFRRKRPLEKYYHRQHQYRLGNLGRQPLVETG